MKKFVIVLAVFLMVALVVPTYASSFADVPSNHWAYEAVNKLVAAGLIQGYPDGTFKGQNDLTRYEIAVMVARLLNDVEEAGTELVDQVDFMVNDVLIEANSGLSAAEAEEVQAILTAVVAKNAPAEVEAIEAEELSAGQAAEVMAMIGDLAAEFESELFDIGVDVAALKTDVKVLKTDVEDLKDTPKSNIRFSGAVETIFQLGDYGDNPQATAEVLSDGDLVDEDLPDSSGENDYDEFPAEKAFYQEIDLSLNGNLGAVNFDLAIDTMTNGFTDYEGYDYKGYGYILGDQSDTGSDWEMDNALLTVNKDDYILKTGDFDDYAVDSYFIDEEDMEGIELTGPIFGLDFKAFVMGEEFDEDGDYYGVNLSKNIGNTVVTGKLYQARDVTDTVTNLALAVDTKLTDKLSVKGEAVYNELDDADTTDSLFNINADYLFSDILTLRAGFETVGDEFNSSDTATAFADLEEDRDYDKFDIGFDFIVNPDNTVIFDYTNVNYNPVDEDKNIYKVGLDNTMGAFTNNAYIKFVENDDYKSTDDNITVIGLGTEYAMSDITTISASIINKSREDFGDYGSDLDYTYLLAGVDYQVAENINWLTDLQYLTGEYDSVDSGNDGEAEGSFLTTQLSVSF